MSFLSFSPRVCSKAILARYLGQKIPCGHSTRAPCPAVDQDSFEAVGIQPIVVASLRAAFPNVQKPTAMQKKLIRAMTNNRNVLLQDDTGTGKSFAVMLALLNKVSGRRMSPTAGQGGDTGKGPTSLLIVPHRDLAYQYLHWIHHLTLARGETSSTLAQHAQVLVRHVNKSTLRGLPARMQEAIRSASSDQELLVRQLPRVLIATPNAVLELLERQPELLIPYTIVVDEVDAQLRLLDGKHPKERRRAKHVPDLVRILDRFYPPSNDKGSTPARHASFLPRRATYKPQLVMISATLRSRLQSALFNTFGWVQRGDVLKLIRKRSSALPSHRLGRSAVHHVLVVSKTGEIRNTVGARPNAGSLKKEERDEEEEGVFYDENEDPELIDEKDKELARAPLAMDPVMLEAVAAVVAVDVPRLALVVLPASAGVRKIVFELRQLGVNAHALDLAESEASRAHVLSRMEEVADVDEGPVLIVATLATVRGIDLPGLSHVMMVGAPDGRSGDVYLHVAGRVGRFGGRGKVITIVEEGGEEKRGRGDGERRMNLVLSRIGVEATRLEHFD